MKIALAALLLAASLAVPATAHADEPVPTVDQVVAIIAELTDPAPPPPTDPPGEDAPAPADCICGGIAGARHNCIRHCQRDGKIIRGQG